VLVSPADRAVVETEALARIRAVLDALGPEGNPHVGQHECRAAIALAMARDAGCDLRVSRMLAGGKIDPVARRALGTARALLRFVFR